MASEGRQTQEKARPLQEVYPPIGVAPNSLGDLATTDAFIQARVGQMKAELERDFDKRMAKIDDLPTKWQLIAGASSGVIITLGLLFTLLSYFGDRQDTSVDRAATISDQLGDLGRQFESIEEKVDEQERRDQIRPAPKGNDGG